MEILNGKGNILYIWAKNWECTWDEWTNSFIDQDVHGLNYVH